MYIVQFRNREEQECECPEDAAALIMGAVDAAADYVVRLELIGPIADEVVEDQDNPDRGAMLMLLPAEAIIADVLEAKACQLEGNGVLVDAGYYTVRWED